MPHQHSPKRRPPPQAIISLTFRSTRVMICPPAPRTSAKCSSNGTGPPDQSCGFDVPPSICQGYYILSCADTRFCFVLSSHHMWLRDHCRCPECFHSITKQRLISTFEVNAFPHLCITSSSSSSIGCVVDSSGLGTDFHPVHTEWS